MRIYQGYGAGSPVYTIKGDKFYPGYGAGSPVYAECATHSKMRDAMPKVRVSSGYSGGNIIDYKYTNYYIEEVDRHYAKLSDTLAKAQTVLDLVNSTVEFEIDI